MLKSKANKDGRRITVGEDKAYDTADHIAHLRDMNVTPHVAQYSAGNPNGRQSAIDGRTTRHPGYGRSQTCQAMIECIVGWGKQHGTMRKTKHRGRERVLSDFHAQPYRLLSRPNTEADRRMRRPLTAQIIAPTPSD